AGTTSLTLNFIYADLPLGGVNSSPITLTAGKAAGLAFVNPLIGTPVNPSDPNTVTTAQAGTLLRDSKNKPIQVKVIDKDGNKTTDSTTVVSLGILRNEGRGPVFIGQGSDPTNITYPSQQSTPGLHSYATATVVNGVATFKDASDIYMTFVGNN